MTSATTKPNATASGAMAPFRHPAFALLWVATVISNVGTWMNEVGSGWLMTGIDPSPVAVSLVQAANTTPIFLFALLAGAAADMVDRRRLLIVVNVLMGIVAGLFATAVHLQMVTAELLIAATFLLGTGAAFMAPAWQAIVPELVDKPQLKAAIGLNSMGINLSRAIGPALAGALIVSVGLVAPFALNAISFVVIILALLIWRPKPKAEGDGLPRERLGAAIRAGLRYAVHSGPLRATLARAAAFFLFASAYWALLPLIARTVLQGDATLYGLLMGAVGLGAVIGAFALPRIRAWLGADRTVAAGTVGTALTLLVFASVNNQVFAVAASLAAGMSWIAVLTTLNASAQTSLPGWVRARGLSIFITLFFGCMALGSLIWGQVAAYAGIETALIVAAVGALALIPVVRGARLGQGDDMDFSASMHWPEPTELPQDQYDRGPVMVQIEYCVPESNRAAVLSLLHELSGDRRRHGAFDWGVMEDPENPSVLVEYFLEASWQDHLRHHHRVTGANRDVQDRIRHLLKADQEPIVRHLLAAATAT